MFKAGAEKAQDFSLGRIQSKFENRLAVWKKEGFSRRLWSKDPTLWAERGTPEITNRLGWLGLPGSMKQKAGELESFAAGVRADGFSHAVLLGMGGSSLAPEFVQKTFGNRPGHPELLVLDSTHPDAVASVEKAIDLERTLFLVSSKSGTTLETLSFYRYFWEKAGAPGRHFVAITDPGTPLAALAKERNFRGLFEAHPEVGGRFSALTEFGLVPAALIGMDVHRFLDEARVAAAGDGPLVSERAAPGTVLGAALGEMARRRNKLTIITSPSLRFFPAWLEQLVAESTGKDGRGMVPVTDEPLISPESYAMDRIFVGLSLEPDHDRDLEARLNAVEKLGHPVILTGLKDLYSLGQEIFRWEIAVAAAGSVLRIHPFNQPDVELTKELTRSVMKRRQGEEGQADQTIETIPADDPGRLATAIQIWLSLARPGDYIAIQAFLAPGKEVSLALQELRLALLKKTGLATTLGYGPRFLHSTGQLHKGGPDEGLFLQLIDEPDFDLVVPETDYTFGELIKAQAIGDYLALKKKGRRVLRVSVGRDQEANLGGIQTALRER